jgi:lysophospholipase L1-like esterase
MKKYILVVLLIVLLTPLLQAKITIFTIGDSTMANRSSGDVEQGWGTLFSKFVDLSEVEIKNHAINGYSTKSFINDGKWMTVYNSLKEGDYVFIQFGHNDAKTDASLHAAPYTGYQINLRKFITETRSKGAIPVLLTSIVRRSFDNRGLISSTHGDYPKAARDISKEMNVALIDMEQKTAMIENIAGLIGSRIFHDFRPGTEIDNTHLGYLGAYVVARLVADGIRELNLQIPLNTKPETLAGAKESSISLAYSLLTTNIQTFNNVVKTLAPAIDKSEFTELSADIQAKINQVFYTSINEIDSVTRMLRQAEFKIKWLQTAPFNATFAIGNPSMEEGVIWDIVNNSAMAMSWTMDAVFSGTKDIALKTGNTSDGYYRFYIWGDLGSSIDVYQEIILPAGIYHLKVDLKPNIPNTTSLYINVDGEKKETKALGSWSNWGTTELEFTVPKETIVRVGVNSTQAVMIDNFQLFKKEEVQVAIPSVVMEQDMLKVINCEGGILLSTINKNIELVYIYSMMGELLKTIDLKSNQLFVPLEQGVYIAANKKIIVK